MKQLKQLKILMKIINNERKIKMEKLTIVQWGGHRSVVKKFYTDTKEETYLILDNQYLMSLDEMGLIK